MGPPFGGALLAAVEGGDGDDDAVYGVRLFSANVNQNVTQLSS